MSKDHGLAGLFGEDGEIVRRQRATNSASHSASSEELPPVLDNADKSPLDLLAEKVDFDAPYEAPAETPPPAPEEPAREEDPFRAAPYEDPYLAPQGYAQEGGILCFLVESDDDKLRRRTLAALNVAAGNGVVSLRTLPSDPEDMDAVLAEAMAQTECSLVAFLTAGTEPADDWALECQRAFAEAPRTAAMTVQAANSDPLSPWARVSFFIDEAERQKGLAAGYDTMVFRREALREIGGQLGHAVRNGRLTQQVQGRGRRIGTATEARVSLVTPGARRDVIKHVKEQARQAARYQAKGKNPAVRLMMAIGVMLSFPFRILEVRSAAKRSVGGTQFREVTPKAAMAIFADRRVRAMTYLFPGKAER